MNDKENFKNILKTDYQLSIEQIDKIEKFISEIISKNKILNLISENDIDRIYERHVFDSLQFIKLLKLINISQDNLKIIDIGSGGGFPAIILSIAMQNSHFTLVESIYKKYSFLIWIKEYLKLINTQIINKRINKNEKGINTYDISIERAAGKINEMIPICLNIIKNGGFFIAWQNFENIEEIQKTKKPYFIYNYLNIRDRKERALFVFKK